jgi:hypothetical protein
LDDVNELDCPMKVLPHFIEIALFLATAVITSLPFAGATAAEGAIYGWPGSAPTAGVKNLVGYLALV